MAEEYPFPLDAATANHLKRIQKVPQPVWERYHNPYHTDPQPDEWPHTVECFAEWYRRHAGLVAMGKPILDEARRNTSFGDPLETLTYSLVNSMELAFTDLHDLIEWAVTAWRQDPLISQVREPLPEDPEPGEETEESETRKVVNLPAQG